ncbi:hypothetical protein FKM82_029913 [Ascaphus truei]
MSSLHAHTPCALSPLASVRHFGLSAPRGSSILAVAIFSLLLLYMRLRSAGQPPHQYNKDLLRCTTTCVPYLGVTQCCTTSG